VHGGAMTAEEFHKTAEIKEDSLRNVVDVRPFGDRQAEAVDFHLDDFYTKITTDSGFTISTPIVIWREAGLFSPPLSAMTSLKNLIQLSVQIGIEEKPKAPKRTQK
jgi:hypothetical protein